MYVRTAKALKALESGNLSIYDAAWAKPKTKKPTARTQKQASGGTQSAEVKALKSELAELKALLVASLEAKADEAEDVIEDDEDGDEVELDGPEGRELVSTVVRSDGTVTNIWSPLETEAMPKNGIGVDDDGYAVNKDGDWLDDNGNVVATEVVSSADMVDSSVISVNGVDITSLIEDQDDEDDDQ
jgi:hypothetical protein